MKTHIICRLKILIPVMVIALISFSTNDCSAQVKEIPQNSETDIKQNNSGGQDLDVSSFETFKERSVIRIDFFEQIISSLKNQNKFKDEIYLLEQKITSLNSLFKNYNSDDEKEWQVFKDKAEKEIVIIENSLNELTGNNK